VRGRRGKVGVEKRKEMIEMKEREKK